jgi:hypothetical protein
MIEAKTIYNYINNDGSVERKKLKTFHEDCTLKEALRAIVSAVGLLNIESVKIKDGLTWRRGELANYLAITILDFNIKESEGELCTD